MEKVKTVSVKEFAEKMQLKIINEGRGEIDLCDISISRPGLQLAGYYEKFANKRIQVIGSAEYEFIKSLPEKARYKSVKQLFSRNLCCLIIARGLEVLDEIDTFAKEFNCALFVSQKVTTLLMHELTLYLSEELAPVDRLHGVLMDVYGVGVLITGKAGIGKSETALELISRGHRLVADDTVIVHQSGEKIIGKSPKNTQFYMEVRGIGIINVKTMYGTASVRPEKSIDIVLELATWTPELKYDRLGNEKTYTKILENEVTSYVVPVQPGRNIPAIIEAAAKKFRLEEQLGMSATDELINNAFSDKNL